MRFLRIIAVLLTLYPGPKNRVFVVPETWNFYQDPCSNTAILGWWTTQHYHQCLLSQAVYYQCEDDGGRFYASYEVPGDASDLPRLLILGIDPDDVVRGSTFTLTDDDGNSQGYRVTDIIFPTTGQMAPCDPR